MKLKILNIEPKLPPEQIHIYVKREDRNNCVRIQATNKEGHVLNNLITFYDNGTYYLHVISDVSCKKFFKLDHNKKIIPSELRYRKETHR